MTQTQTIYCPGWSSDKEEEGEEGGIVILLLSGTKAKMLEDAVAQTVAFQTRW